MIDACDAAPDQSRLARWDPGLVGAEGSGDDDLADHGLISCAAAHDVAVAWRDSYTCEVAVAPRVPVAGDIMRKLKRCRHSGPSQELQLRFECEVDQAPVDILLLVDSLEPHCAGHPLLSLPPQDQAPCGCLSRL